MTHIRLGKVLIIGSDNGLSPGRRQAIILTNAGTLLIWPLGTNFSEILIEINTFSFKQNAFENVVWQMAAICLGLNVLTLDEMADISQTTFLLNAFFSMIFFVLWFKLVPMVPIDNKSAFV